MGTHKSEKKDKKDRKERKESKDKKRRHEEVEDDVAVVEKPAKKPKDRKEKKSKDKSKDKDDKKERRRKEKEERRLAKEEKKKAKKEKRKRAEETPADTSNTDTEEEDDDTKPDEQTVEPDEQTVEPDEQTVEPDEQTVEPDEQTVEPDEQTVEPDEQTVEPEEQTTEPDGLQRFPDFSQDQELSTESALKAARMGIPHWLAHPTTIDRDLTVAATDPRFALSKHTLSRCSQEGITDLFAVQTAVIPVLRAAHTLSKLRQHVRDLCVSAPTGSGKTLAYVLPIVEKLRARLVVRLRALVVLPTRDLAHQVKECFDHFCIGTDLRVGLATGDVSLAKEQAMLVEDSQKLRGGASKVDILVCTPGRLVDHLSATQNFTLQHLEFWVMDEADRLLGEAYQEWLPRVQASIEAVSHVSEHQDSCGVPVHDACTERDPLAKLDLLARPAPRIQKLLFSATLTQDPAKIARLQLVRPLYIAITHDTGKYTFPSTLREHYATCDPSDKPLFLIYMLWQRQITGGVCFAKSLEAAHRLAQIVQTWISLVPDSEWPQKRIVVAEYSSDLAAAERARIMRMFKQGEIHLLICSDLIARGLDVDQVEAVINYDVPTHMSQYTHRVGRTARAGREGSAYTLVEAAQAFHFKKMLKDNGHWEPFVTRVNPETKVLDMLRKQYEEALKKVSDIYN